MPGAPWTGGWGSHLRVAGGHHSRDRDRHVGAKREHVALLVEGAVARARGVLVAALTVAGYGEVHTPALEYEDVLRRAGAR